jgi:hypothetical protein
MLKESYHPKAYLSQIKNIKSGLGTRTKVLDVLELHPSPAPTVAKESSLSYPVVFHHLRLLEDEGTVTRKGKKPCVWLLTGKGQRRLLF